MKRFNVGWPGIRNFLILFVSFFSMTFFNGLAGCDNAPSAKDTSSSAEGTPVDLDDNAPPPAAPEVPEEPDGFPTTPIEPPAPSAGSSVKNVILMVGSGMGPSQIGEVVQSRRLRDPFGEPLALERLMAGKYFGMVSTYSYRDLVSDTAAANSAIACGLKVRNNTIALNANGNPCLSIVEHARQMEKATGLVTNMALSYPGSAAYLTHHLRRQDQSRIAAQLLTDNPVDVLLGGGLSQWLPQFSDPASTLPMRASEVTECATLDPKLDSDSERADQEDILQNARTLGYRFVCNGEQLNGIANLDDGKVLGIFSSHNFPYSVDQSEITGLPNLAEMTGKALELLSTQPNGFLLVVHSGLTHFAARDNDPGTLMHEGLAFNQAVARALEFTENNDETLLIVTADHDTAGFAFANQAGPGGMVDLPSGDSYEAPLNYAPFIRLDLLEGQAKSFYAMTMDILPRLYGPTPDLNLDTASDMLMMEFESKTPYRLTFDQAREVLQRQPGADNAETKDFHEFFIHDNIHTNLLGRAVAKQTSTVWGSGTPTSTPVMIFAAGPDRYAAQLRGFIDNTKIGKLIRNAMLGR